MSFSFKLSFDDLLLERQSTLHQFSVASIKETTQLANAFGDCLLAEQNSQDRLSHIFSLGVIGAVNTGKTYFCNQVIACGGKLKKKWGVPFVDWPVSENNDFGKVVHADTFPYLENREIIGGMRSPRKLMLRHLFTSKGLDIVEHPEGSCRRDFHTIVCIRHGAKKFDEERSYEFYVPPALEIKASFQNFLKQAGAFRINGQ